MPKMQFSSQFRRSMTVLFALIAILVFSGLETMAQDEKVLVVGLSEVTDSLDPAKGYTQTSGIVERVIYQTLVTFPSTDASKIIPMLAKSWDISSDGKTYTFHLQDG